MTDNEIAKVSEQVYAKIQSQSIDIEQLKEVDDLTGSTIPVAKDGRLGKARYESLTLDRISDNDIDGLSAATPVSGKQATDMTVVTTNDGTVAATKDTSEQSATDETVIKRVAAMVSTAEPEPQKATVTDASAPRSASVSTI